MQGSIFINDMQIHAYHGVLPQERVVGNDYIINAKVDYATLRACYSDDVEDAINYAIVAELIKEEMARQSNLLENVVLRICRSVLTHFEIAQSVTITLCKVAPPMSIDCSGAGVSLTMNRSEL